MTLSRAITLFLAFIGATVSCSAQDDLSPFEYHVLMPFDTVVLHERNESFRLSQVIRNYTFLGEYSKSDSMAAYVFPERFDSLSTADIAMLDEYDQVDALLVIDSLSKLHNIVLINENHLYPFHRVFAHNLIDDLAENGYSLLGMEALCINYPTYSGIDSTDFNLFDTQLNTRGYPLYSGYTGTYTKEPQMANMMRKSLATGYTLFGYDKMKGDRELNQAKMIASFRRKFPDRKILVLCGFMHLGEDKVPGINLKLMGQYLKEDLGEEILTIEQTRLSYSTIRNSKLYNHIDPQSSVVLRNEKGDVFGTFANEDSRPYDVSVFHPRFDKVDGRPMWLYKREGAVRVDLDGQITIEAPVTVIARKIDEPNSTPVDIVHLRSLYHYKPLFLDRGSYSIEISNLKGQKQVLPIVVE